MTSVKHLIPFGYAPGNYMNICTHCNNQIFNCDKRAYSCRECAEVSYQYYTAQNQKGTKPSE